MSRLVSVVEPAETAEREREYAAEVDPCPCRRGVLELVLLAERSLRRLGVTRHHLDLAAELVAGRDPEVRSELFGERFGLTYALARANEVTGHRVQAALCTRTTCPMALRPELGHSRIDRALPSAGDVDPMSSLAS